MKGYILTLLAAAATAFPTATYLVINMQNNSVTPYYINNGATASVPEPSTLILCAAGLLLVLISRRAK